MKRRDFFQKTLLTSTTALAFAGISPSFALLEPMATQKFNFMQKTHPNLTLINDFFDAYSKNNMEGIKKVLDKNIKWHIPGEHPLSGTKIGIDEVLAFFKALTKGAFKAEPIIMGVNDDYVIDCHRNWSNIEKLENLNAMSCLLWRIENHKIKEVHNFPQSQKDVNKFFNELYG